MTELSPQEEADFQKWVVLKSQHTNAPSPQPNVDKYIKSLPEGQRPDLRGYWKSLGEASVPAQTVAALGPPQEVTGPPPSPAAALGPQQSGPPQQSFNAITQQDFAARFGGEGRKAGEKIKPAVDALKAGVVNFSQNHPFYTVAKTLYSDVAPAVNSLTYDPNRGLAKNLGGVARGVVNLGGDLLSLPSPLPAGITEASANFAEGFYGPPMQGPVQEFAAAAPESSAPATPAPTLEGFISGLTEAYNMDLGAPAGQAASGALGGGEQSPGVDVAREDLKRSRSRLEEKVDEMAQGSSLPEPVFKDRLANVLVGIALGYARDYGSGRSVGQSLTSGLAAGGAAGLEYNREIEHRRDRVRLEKLAAQRSALQIEGQLHTADSASLGREEQVQAIQERTKQLELNSIRAADAQLRAAQAERLDPDKIIQLATHTLDLKQKWAVYNNPMLDAEITLPGRGKVKISTLDPREQDAAIKALQAPEALPALYEAAMAQAQKMIDAKHGGSYELRMLGAKPEEILQNLATSLMMQQFLGTVDLSTPAQE